MSYGFTPTGTVLKYLVFFFFFFFHQTCNDGIAFPTRIAFSEIYFHIERWIFGKMFKSCGVWVFFPIDDVGVLKGIASSFSVGNVLWAAVETR